MMKIDVIAIGLWLVANLIGNGYDHPPPFLVVLNSKC
jgi:hypothetical protein